MEALSSTTGTLIYPNTNIIVKRPFSINNKVSSCNLSCRMKLLGKDCLGDRKNDIKGFKFRNNATKIKGFEESKRGEAFKNVIRRKNLAIFVSGGGSNFRSIHEGIISGMIHGDVVVLVTDKPGCGGAEYARSSKIPVVIFPSTKSFPEGLSNDQLVTALRNLEVDFILLAGFLKLIPLELVEAYPKSILNIHPSLLPSFGGKGYYGQKVHKSVIASGARYSGPTVHFVDENFDTGRILAQRVVPVLADDSAEQLAARVLLEEHKVYTEVVSALCEERIVWREDGVPIIRDRANPDKYY